MTTEERYPFITAVSNALSLAAVASRITAKKRTHKTSLRRTTRQVYDAKRGKVINLTTVSEYDEEVHNV